MKTNITAGDCLNNILVKKYKEETFIPFREAMNNGKYMNKLFSEEFLIERSLTHNVTLDDYKEKINDFIEIINNIDEYQEIKLWFGNDEFCLENLKVVIQTLLLNNYKGTLILNTVVEETGEIIDTKKIK